MFREYCLLVVLSSSHKDRFRGVEGCGTCAKFTAQLECAEALDKRHPTKETWPGIGALAQGMEDEFASVRIGAIKAIAKIAQAHPLLRDQVSRYISSKLNYVF